MNQFFDITHRNLLELCPPGVDPVAWQAFRSDYASRESLPDAAAPVQLDMELNGGCNMACPFCIHGYGDKIPNIQLSVEDFQRVVREAVKIGVKSLKLNYINEPMLRKDLEECIRFAREAGMLNVFMVTNGTLLTEARRESLLASGITKVFVSIDAATSETYNKQRLSGRYDLVVSNVKAFIELRNSRGLQFPLIRVSFLRNAINAHEEAAFREQWEGVADMVTFQTMTEIPGMATGLVVGSGDVPSKGCDFPFKQLVVDHQGNIQPCCKLGGKQLHIGNIRDMTLQQAWDAPKSVALRKLHQGDGWRDHPVCAACMRL